MVGLVALAASLDGLLDLDMHGCKLTGHVGTDGDCYGVAVFCKTLETNTTLQSLDISETGLTRTAAKYVTAALKKNTSLTTVVLKSA